AAAGVTISRWPLHREAEKDGIDPSWQFSMHRAFHDRPPFAQVVFTRGPLGFLNAPQLWFVDTWAIALAANVIVAVVLAYAVLRLLGLRLSFVWSIVAGSALMLILNAVVFLT